MPLRHGFKLTQAKKPPTRRWLRGLLAGMITLEIGGSKKHEPRTIDIPLEQVEKANLVPEI